MVVGDFVTAVCLCDGGAWWWGVVVGMWCLACVLVVGNAWQ